MTTANQLPPHNPEEEEAVLGSILIDPDALYEVMGILKPEAFHSHANKEVYAAMLRLSQRREAVDTLTVLGELKRHGKTETVGGEAYIVGLVSSVPTSLNVAKYAKDVYNSWIRRGMIRGGGEIATIAYNEEMTIEEAQAKAQQIAAGFVSGNQDKYTTTAYEEAQRLYTRSEEAMSGVIPPRLDMPFLALKHLRPKKGNFVIVGARPGMGKTSLLCQLVLSFAKRGKRVLFFSLEMSAEETQQRIMSIESGIPHELLDGDEKTNELTDEQWSAYAIAVDAMSKLDIVIHDKRGITVEEVGTAVSRDVMLNGDNTVVVVDHTHLLKAHGFSDQFPVPKYTHISQTLKAMAGNNKVWMIVAAQLSRAVEQRQDKRPVLSDLRESGSFEQDADVIMFLYRDEYYNPDTTDSPGIAELNTAKHRNGKTLPAMLGWSGERMMFHDLR